MEILNENYARYVLAEQRKRSRAKNVKVSYEAVCPQCKALLAFTEQEFLIHIKNMSLDYNNYIVCPICGTRITKWKETITQTED